MQAGATVGAGHREVGKGATRCPSRWPAATRARRHPSAGSTGLRPARRRFESGPRPRLSRACRRPRRRCRAAASSARARRSARAPTRPSCAPLRAASARSRSAAAAAPPRRRLSTRTAGGRLGERLALLHDCVVALGGEPDRWIRADPALGVRRASPAPACCARARSTPAIPESRRSTAALRRGGAPRRRRRAAQTGCRRCRGRAKAGPGGSWSRRTRGKWTEHACAHDQNVRSPPEPPGARRALRQMLCQPPCPSLRVARLLLTSLEAYRCCR